MASEEASPRPGKRKRGFDADNEEPDIKSEGSDSGADLFVSRTDKSAQEDDADGTSSAIEDDQISDFSFDCEYEECEEPWPTCIAYDSAFSQLKCDLNSIPRATLKIIDESGCHSQRVLSLRKNALELTTVPRSNREKIALLGNTGAGKSSLLNSVLDRPGFARAVSAAESCTHVCTEYECPFPEQTTEFAAIVEYSDMETVEDLLKRLLDDYNTWTFATPEDLSKEETVELNRKSSSAFKTFRSLFCDKIEMESTRASKEFLQQSFDRSGPDAFATMIQWCEALLEARQREEEFGTEYIEADTQKDLVAQLNPLTTSSSWFREPALWPLVKKLRIGIRGPRILDYVVLVDLPGLDDTNQVRAKASHEMMRSCDTVYVTGKVTRIITDTAVDALILRYGNFYNIVVICTGIDQDTDDALADYMRLEGQSLGDYDALYREQQRLQPFVTKQEQELSSLEKKLRDRTQGTKKLNARTKKEVDQLKLDIERLRDNLAPRQQALEEKKQATFEILVDARNAFVQRRLREDKEDYIGHGKQLKVCCVSNKHYSMLKGAENAVKPRLEAPMTGIPALRDFILKRAAPVQVATLEAHINHRYSVFMEGLALWAKSYYLEDSGELLQSIAAPASKIGGILERYLGDVMQASEKHIVDPIRDHCRDISRVALDRVANLDSWYWSTIKAFVRRDGNHQTSVCPRQSWNEDFLRRARDVVNQHWADFEKELGSAEDRLQQYLTGLIGDIAAVVEAHPAFYALPMDRIRELYKAQTQGIRHAVQAHSEEIARHLRNMRYDLIHESPSGFFTKVMQEAYETAKAVSGTGYKQRVLLIFRTHLSLQSSRSPFLLMCKDFAKSLKGGISSFNADLSERVDQILDGIYTQFRDLVDERVVDKAEEKLSHQFGEFLKEAKPRFEDMKLELKRIKRRHGMPC